MALLDTVVGSGINLLGGLLGSSSNASQMEANRAFQQQFAQNAIQWKVEDAKKAGIHPLYALGAPTMSPAIQTMQDPLASALSSMGQDISRARLSEATPEDRNVSIIGALGIERAQLQNDLLRSQIRRLNGQTGPGMPSVQDPWNFGMPNADVNDARRVTNDPNKITPGAANDPGSGPGANPDVDWLRTRDGGYTIAPSKGAKDRVEDMGLEPWLWSYRNRIGPYIGGHQPPPFTPPAPPGQVFERWRFNHFNQTWYPVFGMQGGGGGY